MTALAAPEEAPPALDPRRWITLVILLMALVIVALDSTILTVSIPTILRDFDTQLPSLQWVLTGYSLTFASLLVIGGRLGDIYGPRRMFMLGAALFGVGSFLASVSTSVPTLLLGESLIEGIGASLMMPATLAIVSRTFTGHERATAFGLWGAILGASVAFGPVIGGWLTTDYSWRWSFRINLIVTPLAVLGAALFIRPPPPSARRQRLDLVGSLLVAVGTFLLVFGLSEGASYGWATPKRDLTVLGWTLWPASRSISAIPLTFVLAVVVLGAFVAWERARQRAQRDPLFEFDLLDRLTFRYGLLTTSVMAMGQLGLLFVMPVFLQDGTGLSALDAGLWLVPCGLFIVLGSQLGSRLTRRIDTTVVVRSGLVLEAIGLVITAVVVGPGITFLAVLPGFALFGIGVGFASSQLTNVVLSEIPQEHAGSASGANTTVRQIGAALGIATIGGLLTSQTIANTIRQVTAADLPPALKDTVVAQVHTSGVGFSPPPGTAPADVSTLHHLFSVALTDGTRPALLFAAAVVAAGAGVSLLIPRLGHVAARHTPDVE